MFDIQRLIIGTALLLAALLLFSCKTAKCIPTTEYVTRDSIVVRHHTDSVRVIDKDSVFVKEKGDTVFVSVTKWRVRDHIVNKVDTVYKDREHTVVQTEVQEVVPGYYKTCAWVMWILVILIAAYIVIRILIRVYLKK